MKIGRKLMIAFLSMIIILTSVVQFTGQINFNSSEMLRLIYSLLIAVFSVGIIALLFYEKDVKQGVEE